MYLFFPLTKHHEEGDDDQGSNVFVEKGGGVEAPEELDEDALGVAGHGLGVGDATADVVPEKSNCSLFAVSPFFVVGGPASFFLY